MMLLGSIACGHPNDGFVLFGKIDVSEGVVVVGLGVCRGDYFRGLRTEHETEEALGCYVEVATVHQTLIEGGVGGSEDYRMLTHDNQNPSIDRGGPLPALLGGQCGRRSSFGRTLATTRLRVCAR